MYRIVSWAYIISFGYSYTLGTVWYRRTAKWKAQSQIKIENCPVCAFFYYIKVCIYFTFTRKNSLDFTSFTFFSFSQNFLWKWGKVCNKLFCGYFYANAVIFVAFIFYDLYYAHMSCNVYCSNDIQQIV